MLVLNPNLSIAADPDILVLEDKETRLTFHGESAVACKAIIEAAPQSNDFETIAARSGFSIATVKRVAELLKADFLAIDTSFPGDSTPAEYLSKIRHCAQFWNKHIMAQHFASRLFAGEATQTEVLGWGIEFYFFVKAAQEYMALGSSRTWGETAMLAPIWDHFAKEAFHSDIFLQGLLACGLREKTIRTRMPVPTTAILTNFLYETSSAGLLEYTTLFAVMQPLSRPATREEVKSKYDFLREKYPFAIGLFNSFESHDCMDIALEHSSLTLEPVLEHRGILSPAEWRSMMRVLEDTANAFILFFEGIQKYYRSSSALRYRQTPNAAMAFALSDQA
jgi:pyrroloquinoline quinone (PQQ) biosynthesis protein C